MIEDFLTDTVSAILEYYSDKKLHHKCGSIDLTTCEEVYSALDSETYRHVFCVQVMFCDVTLMFCYLCHKIVLIQLSYLDLIIDKHLTEYHTNEIGPLHAGNVGCSEQLIPSFPCIGELA